MSKQARRKGRIVWINTGREIPNNCPAMRNMFERDKTDLASAMKRAVAASKADSGMREAILATQSRDII